VCQTEKGQEDAGRKPQSAKEKHTVRTALTKLDTLKKVRTSRVYREILPVDLRSKEVEKKGEDLR